MPDVTRRIVCCLLQAEVEQLSVYIVTFNQWHNESMLWHSMIVVDETVCTE